MLLVAIDPGLSTGVSVFISADTGETFVSRSFTTRAPHDHLRTFLAGLPDGTDVVCERGPTNRRQADTCAKVEALVRELVKTIHWVRPSDWKRKPDAKLEPGDQPGTKHERDALRMGRWYLACRGHDLAVIESAS